MPTPSYSTRKIADQTGYNTDFKNLNNRITSVEGNLLALSQKVNGLPSSTGGTTVVQQVSAPSSSAGISYIGFSLPASTFSLNVPSLSNNGTFTASFVNQSANTFLRGPNSGGAAIPMWGALVSADLSSILVDGETPGGLINGVNTAFTLANTPNPSTSVHVYMSGLRVSPSAYTVSGNTVTFSVAPAIGSTLLIDYRK